VQALHRDDWAEAQAQAEEALQAAPDTPLPSLLHLLAVWRPGHLDLARPLAEGFHARWPGCVAFSLCLAECLLAGADSRAKNGGGARASDEARALALLHEAGALDPAGEVAGRYWGSTHPYLSLWPNQPDPELPGPLPQDVSSILGMNRLAGGSVPDVPENGQGPAAKPAQPDDDLGEIQAELERLEKHLNPPKKRRPEKVKKERRGAPASGHFSTPPALLTTHLIVSSRTRLIRKYGEGGAAAVATLLDELAEATALSSQAAVLVVYVDDRDALRTFDLRPVDADRPWEIKLLLKDLANAVSKKGGLVASVLIAGGDDIIPFHRLPNPVDDSDGDVPSDNPYATPDENYLVPEWALGRLPSPAGRDPEAFLRLLRADIAAHRARSAAKNGKKSVWLPGILEQVARWLAAFFQPAGPNGGRGQNFGYAARAWQTASTAVFAPIGDKSRLSTCPPLDVTGLPPDGLAPAPLSYFNLHGVEDGPEWYGQRDSTDARLPQYPIALRPANVANNGRAPGLVFSEACYGANIQDKGIEDALCLKFLDSGSRAVVGSTKIAYGSIGTPLIGADLLGRMFWDNLKEGWPIGEALRLAKIEHAREMHTRQGYLDGEDQKTLMSFALYGDPLLPEPNAAAKGGAASRPKGRRPARPAEGELTLCADDDASDPGLSRPEAVAHVKSLVKRHLPGMDDWAVHVAQQRRIAPGAGPSPRTSFAAKALGPETGNTVFTLSKSLPIDPASRRALAQFVRVTVNREGKVVKMAVSR
jgi:hypothetical protein